MSRRWHQTISVFPNLCRHAVFHARSQILHFIIQSLTQSVRLESYFCAPWDGHVRRELLQAGLSLPSPPNITGRQARVSVVFLTFCHAMSYCWDKFAIDVNSKPYPFLSIDSSALRQRSWIFFWPGLSQEAQPPGSECALSAPLKEQRANYWQTSFDVSSCIHIYKPRSPV